MGRGLHGESPIVSRPEPPTPAGRRADHFRAMEAIYRRQGDEISMLRCAQWALDWEGRAEVEEFNLTRARPGIAAD